MSRGRARRPAAAERPRTEWIAAWIAALAIVVNAGVLANGFVNFDDDVYVTANPHVLRGLDGDSIAWALTATDASNWHPVTWWSHMLDVEWHGLAAGGHHATSLALHAANAALLFLLFARMTGAVWRSALVAALFAAHPLHVESVAWIAERKDVLSTLFWFLTLAAWLRYVRSRTAARALVVALVFAAGLMAKPMLVTLPFTLLLLDAWPLGRLGLGARALVVEKLPLFALSAASCAVTVVAQRRGGALQGLEAYPFDERLGNAIVAAATYLVRTVWPVSLAVLYPHPHAPLVSWPVAGALALLAALSFAAWRARRTVPAVPFGWLWYLGTLVPVIGLVQVGGQATADRYTYVPLIGIFVAAAWGLGALAGEDPARRRVVAGVSAAVVAALALAARAQVATWRDSTTLFTHALAVTRGNWLAENNLGRAFSERGRSAEAIAHYEAALGIAPDFVGARLNLANEYARTGRWDDAIAAYGEAARLSPGTAAIPASLGVALARAGRLADAIAAYERALRLRPDDAGVLRDLGLALGKSGRPAEAAEIFARVVRARPGDAEAYNDLGVALANAGRMREALDAFETAVKLRPDYDEARRNAAAARGTGTEIR